MKRARTLLAALALMATPFVTANAASVGPMSMAPGVQSPVIQVQGWSCRACRRDCSRERAYCGYGDRCQARFVACMRACWEDYCRR